ncbi:hypothetical protein INR49_004198 [Caranx melampygus]|nr:hypothetical protein INR49_004198 [Caranx melampygus]
MKVLVMEGRIYTVALLCLVLSGAGALQVRIPQALYEHLKGDNVTLPCEFTTARPLNPQSFVIITWSVVTDAEEALILTHTSFTGRTFIKSTYEGRASIDVDLLSGKANLKLSSVMLTDSSTYECRVLIPGDDEGKPADSARLVVLGAPSTPVCKIQGVAEYHQNINLTCVSEEGWPQPTYRWEARDVRNKPRTLDPRATQRGGVLSLYDISIHTSGYYICTSANKVHSASCNITLAVRPPAVLSKWPTLADLLSRGRD